MARQEDMAWMRGGAALSLAVSAVCFLFRRRFLGRIALGLAVAFLERIRESRLGIQVHSLLARASAPAGRGA
jgi:hypothetical protein